MLGSDKTTDSSAAQPVDWSALLSEMGLSRAPSDQPSFEPVTFDYRMGDNTFTLHGPVSRPEIDFQSFTKLLLDDGPEIEVWAGTDMLAALLSQNGYASGSADYPADASALILEHLARPALDSLANVLSANALTVTKHTARKVGATPDDDAIVMRIEGAPSGETFLAIKGEAQASAAIAGLFKPKEGGSGADEEPGEDIDLECCLLTHDLEISGSDLASMTVDDVFMPDQDWENPAQYRLVVADRAVADVVLKDGMLSAVSGFTRLDPTAMAGTKPPCSMAQDGLAQLRVEVARTLIPVETLKAMENGEPYAFGELPKDTIRLIKADRAVCTGMIVRSGDQVGIQITSIT